MRRPIRPWLRCLAGGGRRCAAKRWDSAPHADRDRSGGGGHCFDRRRTPAHSYRAGKGQGKNAVTSIINDAVNETLSSEAISYGDLVTLEKDTAGQVTVLAANTAQLNTLRTEILGRILEQVEQLDSQELGIPLGNLTGFATASDLGPVLPVRVLTAATPTAAFEHVFTSSGINQTLHQVMLNVQVECTLLIPGGTVDTVVEAQVCAAETLLVGQVPDTYLELPGGL